VKSWDALEEAAAAMRRLNRAVATHDLSDAELRELTQRANELAGRFEAAPAREKRADMMAMAHWADMREGRPAAIEVGQRLEFDPFSAGGGRLHPSSIHFHFHRDGEASVAATVNVHRMFQGPPERVHGGVVALIIDELMGTVNRITGRPAFTARLTVNLRAAAPIETDLAFRAWVHDVDDRKITIRAEGRAGDDLFVDADALFIAITPETIYGDDVG